MKVLRVAALALLSVQCFGAVFDSNRFLASLRSAPLGGQHDVRAQRGPAVNWTWSSWLAGGPTCVDNSNLTLVDIPPTTESVRKVLAQLQGLLDYKAVQTRNMLGMTLGITYNGKTLFFGSAGTTEYGKKIKPTMDTVFSVGSVTKIFTTLMMTMLADKGVVQLSDSATKYFNAQNPPVFAVKNAFDPAKGAAAVTLESLASHTSGLPRESPCLFNKECTDSVIMAVLEQLPLSTKPLTHPHYSNLGTALLGRCCERAVRAKTQQSSITYEQWVAKNILAPFNMTSSGFDYPDEIRKRMAIGYTISGTSLVKDPSWATSLYWSNPCGGMYSTARDMLNFMARVMDDRGDVLSRSAREQYFMPGASMPDGVSSFGRAAWESVYANGFRTYTKSGLVGGFASTIALVPELKLGAVAWINANAGLEPSGLTAYALNQLVPVLLSELREKQPKHGAPSGVEQVLGTYTVNNIKLVEIKSDAQTAATGIYTGSVYTESVRFVYDAELSALYDQDTLVFHYYQVPQDGLDTCFITRSSGSFDSLAIFSKQQGAMFVNLPDLAIFYLPKDKA